MLSKQEHDDLFREMISRPFNFWCCPNKEHKHVRWDCDVAICEECGIKSTDKQPEE